MDFLKANDGLISISRSTKYEFLKHPSASQTEFSQLLKNHNIDFIDNISYRNVISEGRALRDVFKIVDANSANKRALGLMDSRQLAASKLTGIDIVTYDLQIFKRAKDLGLNVHFLDLSKGPGIGKAAQKAINYVPQSVTTPQFGDRRF